VIGLVVGLILYLAFGAVTCVTFRRWVPRYLERGDEDREPPFFEYLVVSFTWPIFLLVVLDDIIRKPPDL